MPTESASERVARCRAKHRVRVVGITTRASTGLMIKSSEPSLHSLAAGLAAATGGAAVSDSLRDLLTALLPGVRKVRAAIDCPREPGLLVVMSDLAKTGYPRLTLEHTDKFLEMSRANGAEATQEDGGTIMEILRVTSGHSGALQMQGSGYLRVEVEGQPASIAACRQRRKFVQQLAGCMADVMAASAAAMLESASLFLHPDLVESVKFSVPAPCSGPPFSRPDDQDTPARLSLQPQPGSCKPTAGTLPDMLPSKQHLPDVNGKKWSCRALAQVVLALVALLSSCKMFDGSSVSRTGARCCLQQTHGAADWLTSAFWEAARACMAVSFCSSMLHVLIGQQAGPGT